MIRGQPFSYIMPEVDVGTGSKPIHYHFVQSLPLGLTFDGATRELMAAMVSAPVQARTAYLYRATDSQGPVPREADLLTYITIEEGAPRFDLTSVILPPTGQTLEVGQSRSWILDSATGSPAPTYSIIGAPFWVSYNAVTRQLTAAPSSRVEPRSYVFIHRATNSAGGANQIIIVTVSPDSTILPGLVQDLRAQLTNNRLTVILDWSPPLNADQSGPLTYRIPVSNGVTITYSSTAGRVFLDGLTTGDYFATVYASGPNGEGPGDTLQFYSGSGRRPSGLDFADDDIHPIRISVRAGASMSWELGEALGSLPITYSLRRWNSPNFFGDPPSWVSLDGPNRILTASPPSSTRARTYYFGYNASSYRGAGSTVRVELTVSGGGVLSAPDFLENTFARSIESGQSESWTLDDAGGNPTPVYSLLGAPSWVSYNTSTRLLTAAPPSDTADRPYIFLHRAMNSQGTVTQTIIIMVGDILTIPGIPVEPFSESSIGSNRATVSWGASTTGGDPTGYDLQYREITSSTWLNEPHSGIGRTNIIYGLDSSTNYEWQVRATNSVGNSDWAYGGTFRTDAASPTLVEPTLPPVDSFSIQQGGSDVRTLPAATAGNPTPSYSLVGAPSWVGFNPLTRELTAAPTSTTAATAYPITYRAMNSQGTASQTFTIIVTEPSSDLVAPTLPAVADFSVQQGGSDVRTLPAATAGNPTPSYSLVGAPSWVGFNPLTRELTAAPPASTPATSYPITYRAMNSQGTANRVFIITVTQGNVEPEFSDSGDTFSVQQGEEIVETLDAATGLPAPVYSLVGAPSWVTYNPVSRELNANPPDNTPATAYNFTHRATNSEGSDDQTITITVTQGDVAPNFSDSGDSFSVQQGASLIRTLDSASGFPTPVYSLVGAPSWVSYNPVSRELNANPPDNTPATAYNFTHRATNSEGSDDQTITITVTQGDVAPNFSDSGDSFSVQQGASLIRTLDSASGFPTPVYSLVGAPSWVTYNPVSRELNANPPDNTPATAYNFTHRATNSEGSDDQTITITVTQGDVAPNFSDSGDSFSVQQGASLIRTLDSASGFPTPVYSLVGAPSWVSYNPVSRELNANPPDNTPATAYNFTHRATNSEGSDDQTITITVTQGDVAPNFSDSGDSFSVQQGASLIRTLDSASGFPTPVYSLVGAPSWVTYNPVSRELNANPPDNTPATAYNFTHRATNSEGSGDQTITVTVTEPPRVDPPTGTHENDVTGNSAEVDWVAPSDTTGVIGYRVEWKRRSEALYQGINIQPATSQYTITGLVAGVLYDWQVRSRGGTGYQDSAYATNSFTTLPF